MVPNSPLVHFILLCVGLLSGALLPRSEAALNSQEQAIADLMAGASGQRRAFLKVDPVLSQVARARATDMARRDYFGHVNPDGYGPNYLVRKAGYQLPPLYSTSADANNVESIAAGRDSASATWSDWMGSSGHKRHLLGESSFYAEQTSVGVGYAYAADSQYRGYWVVISAPPSDAVTLTISSPAANARLGSNAVLVTGTADGGTPVHTVRMRVENSAGISAFQEAAGTANYSLPLDGLVPGNNTIRVQALDPAGIVLAQVTRIVQYVVSRDLVISVIGDGRVTDGFLGTSNRALGRKYTVTAFPVAGSLFAGWSGGITSAQAKLTFTMTEGLELAATFVPNPFNERKGIYTGLLLGDGDRSVPTTGRLQIKVNGVGAFTGQIVLGGKRYSVKGRFNPAGDASVKLGRSGGNAVLHLDTEGMGGVTAAVTLENSTSSSVASLGLAKSVGAMHAGRYTVSIPRNLAETNPAVPAGNGYATLRVSKSGQGRLTGSLADRSSFSVGGSFGVDSAMTIYAPLNGGVGVLAGTLRIAPTEISDLDGTVLWVKQAAFATDALLVACRFEPPAKGETILDVAAGENNATIFLEGDLVEPVTQPVTLDSANRVSLSASLLEGLRLKVNPATGTYSGSFVHPETGAKARIGGVILQKQNAGFGYFHGTQASGYTSLSRVE